MVTESFVLPGVSHQMSNEYSSAARRVADPKASASRPSLKKEPAPAAAMGAYYQRGPDHPHYTAYPMSAHDIIRTPGHAQPTEPHRYPTSQIGGLNAVPSYRYDQVYVPPYLEENTYKDPRNGEEMMYSRPMAMQPGGGVVFYGMPGYMHPSPAQPQRKPLGSDNVGHPAAYSAEHQIVELKACVSEFRRMNVQLQDELLQAQREIESLKKQIGELMASEKERSDGGKSSRRYWSAEEHQMFLEALEKFGPKNVRLIANYVGTRSPIQVRTHAQKYFLKMQRKNSQNSLKETDEASSTAQENKEQGLSNSRRCRSEGDLFRVRHDTIDEKNEDGDEDSAKETAGPSNERGPEASEPKAKQTPAPESPRRTARASGQPPPERDAPQKTSKPPMHPKSAAAPKGGAD